MTIEDFMRSTALQDDWRKTWREPHMQAGLTALLSAAFAIQFPTPEGTSAIDKGALRDAAREGAKTIVLMIEKMGGLLDSPPQKLPEPAYVVKPEDDEPREPVRKKA